MNHLDLFSGIAGFRVALDICRVPIEHSYYSDIEDYANQVYAKNYPDSTALGDIRKIDGRELRARHSEPWILTGGFPCQDVSTGNRNAKGLKGKRSGLWYEMLRVIGELQPELVIIENVGALRNRGLADVLRGLDGVGYDAEWQTLSAQEVGAIHQRKRMWIAAHPRNAVRDEYGEPFDPHSQRGDLGDGAEHRTAIDGPITRADWQAIEAEGTFLGEPYVGRKADGLSTELDAVTRLDADTFEQWRKRNAALGNAIVPQCAARVIQQLLTSDSH